MRRRPQDHADAQALRLMHILGELDVWNDARDGAPCWYRVVRASYRRGELSRKEWAAYRASYGAARRAQDTLTPAPAADAAAAPDVRPGSRVA